MSPIGVSALIAVPVVLFAVVSVCDAAFSDAERLGLFVLSMVAIVLAPQFAAP